MAVSPWLGVGASKWTLRTREDAVQSAELLAELCSHLLSSLPTLIPDDIAAVD
jgi:hypothetical protein